MDKQVNDLVTKIWEKFQHTPPNHRLLIAVSGIPGSGKTTLASTLSSRLNTLSQSHSSSNTQISTTLPMDGYHLSRLSLSSLPNSTEAIFRRGAAFTFDSASYLSLIKRLREPIIEGEIIYAPSFSHSLKDPVENDIPIPPSSRIVIIEGLYLSLTTTPLIPPKIAPDPPLSEDWEKAGDMMDMHIFIDIPLEVAGERLVKRHVSSGICRDEEEARKRVWESDLRNGKEILEGRRGFRRAVDWEVESLEDGGWR